MEKHFDEYQLTIRHRATFRAMLGTYVLVLLNGWICTMHPWAPPLMQAVVLVLLPTLYFVTATMARGAYLSRQERHPVATGGLFLGVGTLFAVVTLMRLSDGAALVENGQLTAEGIAPMMAFFLLYLGTVILACSLRQRRDRDE